MTTHLFPIDLPELLWSEFKAAEFAEPVRGEFYCQDKPPCFVVSTGCLIDAHV